MPAYQKPPITEAVIELKFADALDQRALENVSRAYADRYPKSETVSNISVRIRGEHEAGPKVETMSEFAGYKRTSESALDILVLGPQQFLISRHAPYNGWNNFMELFAHEWLLWKSKVGYKRLSRVGVRYINRIDVPDVGGIVEDADYFNIRVETPKALGLLHGAASQSKFAAPDLKCQLQINTAIVESPLPNRIAFVLDIDIATNGPDAVPQKDEELFELLDKMRHRKNLAFEACISDKARELFDQ